MEKNYWLTRWETGNTRFNESIPHRFLVKYFNHLDTKPYDEVLVPLCGKSIDMAWMMQTNRKVIGVEISPIAINQFLDENSVDFSELACDHLVYKGALCTIHNTDLFGLKKNYIQSVTAVYDRGCLTALPPKTLCKQYVHWLKDNLPQSTKILLVCFEHNNLTAKEPPFHTSINQLHEYFGQDFEICLLEKEHIEHIKPHWAERGIQVLHECVYLIQRN